MTSSSDGGLSRDRVARMERLCAAAERVGRIALAPSAQWCDHVCGAITAGMRDATAMAIMGLIDDAGRVIESEMCGVSTSAGPSSAAAHEIRAGLRGVRSLGVRVQGRWPIVLPLDGITPAGTSLAGRCVGREGATARYAALAIWSVGKRQVAVALRGGEPGEAAEMLWVLMPGIARRAATALGANMLHRRQWLSPLEERVMRMLAAGHDVPSIAEKLSRSRHTIHDHVKSLHRKMGINTRAELVARALGRMPGVLRENEAQLERKSSEVDEDDQRDSVAAPVVD